MTDCEIADALDATADQMQGKAKGLLREAAQRLRLRGSPQFRAVSVRQVCAERLTEFEGVLTETGDDFFIRYHHRSLTLFVDDHLCEYEELSEIEHPDPDRISFDKVRALLANTIELPDRCE
jgi:hypothetical protein